MNVESKSLLKRVLPWLVPLPRGIFDKPQTGKQILVYYLCRIFAFYILLLILLMVLQRWLIYQPTRVSNLSVDQAGAPFGVVHDISTQTDDGLDLKGWHFLAGQVGCTDRAACDIELAKGRPVVILLHGNGGNRLHRTETCRLLASLNMHVFAFDYRGVFWRQRFLPVCTGRTQSPRSSDVRIDGQALGPDLVLNDGKDYRPLPQVRNLLIR